MILTFIAMFLGLLLGFAMFGTIGGVVGVLAGMVLGFLVQGARDSRGKVPQQARLVREDQRVLCVPKGQVATATFVRDARTGRWLDVERCTLCDPEDDVRCTKRCLLLIRDVMPRRRHAVRAPEEAPAG